MTINKLIERLQEQCERDAAEHCPDEIVLLQREAIAALEDQAKKIESLAALAASNFSKAEGALEQIDALQADADCFNFWVHEAWNNPSDMARLLNCCETADDYRKKIIPLMTQRKAIIDTASRK